ncbi:alpha/beta fold hydrolase [Sphingomonas quercus]|uniref:Alpha/beta hydrolase n=1 Tax=Sphingomonas quercus TaxID=2842451 RepID=A0ABS6BKK6_9SPHN|nr:alpha/beta hydrolase [Sphingomonas quercus]MBU3078826.1 alpha/beta hydrolase [Sphingomonas quercus]
MPLSALALAAALAAAGPSDHPAPVTAVRYHRVDVDGVGVFYREAGNPAAPAVVLLHGYPSSSRMWGPLLPLLARKYHVIAPDYPGFGHSDAPPPGAYIYTFDRLAETINRLLARLAISRYVLVMQDYGGPVGFRLAIAHPSAVRAIIVQNANAYREGLGPKWAGIAGYWSDPTKHQDQVDAFVSLAGAKQRHLGLSPHIDRYDPDSWTDEFAFLSRPGERAIQAALLRDYRHNVASYPKWQDWMRRYRPPALILWGKYDPSFIVPGAHAYLRDLPEAELHILDAGHFALDEQKDEVARLMLDFLGRLPLD